MNLLPAITGNRTIDWLNEHGQRLTPPAVDNIETALRVAADTFRRDLIPALSGEGLTLAEAIRAYRYELVGIVANGALCNRTTLAVNVRAWEHNQNEQALLDHISRYVPTDWQPTPRAPEAPGPGDMTGVFKPLPTALQAIINRLRANPTPDDLRAAAIDLAGLAGLSVAPALPDPSPGQPAAVWLVPAGAMSPRTIAPGVTALRPNPDLYAAAGYQDARTPPEFWRRDGGVVEWCVQAAIGSKANAEPMVANWLDARPWPTSPTGWALPQWSDEQLRAGAIATLQAARDGLTRLDADRLRSALAALGI